MKWNKKEKKVKAEKKQPELGDLKRRVMFALFPTKVEDKILWLEKYTKVWEYKTKLGTTEYIVSSGLLEDAVTFTGLLNERTYSKSYIYQDWEFKTRELI